MRLYTLWGILAYICTLWLRNLLSEFLICKLTNEIIRTKVFCTEGAQDRHPLQLYMEYVSHLYRKMPAISEQERFEVDMHLKYHECVDSCSKSFRISMIFWGKSF
jgi:hypothetical protein